MRIYVLKYLCNKEEQSSHLPDSSESVNIYAGSVYH